LIAADIHRTADTPGSAAGKSSGSAPDGALIPLAHPLENPLTSPATTRLLACCAITTLIGGLTACSVNAGNALPEEKTFAFSGKTLNVKSHEIPTDLVAGDRDDIKVTRWFDAKAGSSKTLRWDLKGDVLDLEAGCTGIALCDARFRVEVPRGVKVLRDGRRTDLRGGK
jgi:hypothetical protein